MVLSGLRAEIGTETEADERDYKRKTEKLTLWCQTLRSGDRNLVLQSNVRRRKPSANYDKRRSSASGGRTAIRLGVVLTVLLGMTDRPLTFCFLARSCAGWDCGGPAASNLRGGCEGIMRSALCDRLAGAEPKTLDAAKPRVGLDAGGVDQRLHILC